ncbi:MAG: tetratricopeptide repeat protein [Acidobacteriota bacterium]|nr:tetratricopeptide repeat protein [Acidobacteriota bacterium]
MLPSGRYLIPVFLIAGFLLFGFGSNEETDVLEKLGIRVTGGAAPGYVEDRACGMCHAQIYHDYQEVGMARSFMRPKPEKYIEAFDKPYVHEASGRIYEMNREGDDLFFKRYQLDESGKPINVYQVKVDWILGSGYHTRVYLYRTPGGELYQLPLGWYTQTQSWGMAPGFDRADHEGVSRRVRRECMFCHNAYPDVPKGSDAFDQPHHYPEQLPEGTGCQRCHGPGEKHVRRAFEGETDRAVLASLIVNPGKLSPQRRDDICYECHMQPTVALPGIRRFGRSDYSFRPGQDLAEYRVALDVSEEGKQKVDRFEINHHPYRLEQSKCFTQSNGALSCLTCHNPHVKIKEPQRAARYRDACLGCHQQETCKLESARAAGKLPVEVASIPADDCSACHMPKRRTHDVVQVLMTDHLIRRRPGGSELTAELEEKDPVLTDLFFLEPERAPKGAEAGIYRAVATLRAGKSRAALEYLKKVIAADPPVDLEPYIALADALLKQHAFEESRQVLSRILAKHPNHPWATERMGIALIAMGKNREGADLLKAYLDEYPESPEGLHNLALYHIKKHEMAAARDLLSRAVAVRPNMTASWYYLGMTRFRLGDRPGAVAAYRRAVELDPKYDRAYLALARILRLQGQKDEAVRYLRHGMRHGRKTEGIARMLEKLQ